MNKVVIPDTVPFVPNGGQLYRLDENKELVAVTDDGAKKLIRAGTQILAPGAGFESYRAVLKRMGFAYAEAADAPGSGLPIRVRTGHIRQESIRPGAAPGIVYTYVAE